MFRIIGIPIKLSYVFLFIWLLDWLIKGRHSHSQVKDIQRIWSRILIVLMCLTLGEIWLSFSYQVISYYETIRGVIVFIFASMAFGLGRSTKSFKPEWLIVIAFLSFGANIIVIHFWKIVPLFVMEAYLPKDGLQHVPGVESVVDYLSMSRPRGLFGNPNSSMLLVNLNVLFIYLFAKNNLLKIPGIFTTLLIVFFPIYLSALMGSRGEFIVSMLLCLLNLRTLTRGNGKKRIFLILLAIFIFCIGIGYNALYSPKTVFAKNAQRITLITKVLEENPDDAATIRRPLIALESFWNRFEYSPILGTGISAAQDQSLSDGTQYFHNDWFYLLAISGIVGFTSFFIIVLYFAKQVGWPVLIPLFLPGLVNTFVLNIPALITFFCLVGLLLSAKSRSIARINCV